MNSLQLASTKFNGVAYGDWKHSMTITLSTKNKLDFVTGEIDKQTDTDDPNLKSREDCNDMIISWILHNVDITIVRNVLYFNSTS